MAKVDDRLRQQIRDNIQASIEQAEKERKQELFKRRLELAREGIALYEAKNLAEATKKLLQYIRILEDGKRIKPGELHPSQFDRKNDQGELLLISGVYWDLAKLYDRTKSKAREKDLKAYLNKFVLFSKGMQSSIFRPRTS